MDQRIENLPRRENPKTIPEHIAHVARVMFDRRLADLSGGNISVRDGNNAYMTPTLSGPRYHWQLEPEDILHGSIDGQGFENNPRFSREGNAHLEIYRQFSDAFAVIHAHPFNIQPFVAALRPIEPVLEGTQKFGTIGFCAQAPAHTGALATNIVDGLRGKEPMMRKHAAAILIPKHGIFVVGRDLYLVVDALERIDWNAWCLVAGRILQSGISTE